MGLKDSSVSGKVDYTSDEVAVDLEQALSTAGLGLYNLKYCLVLAMFLVSAIIEPVGYSYVLPAARCDLNMTDSQRGFIASVPYIGIVLTSYPWGYLVDTRGRKPMAIYSSLVAGTFGMLAAFMPDIISFTACKFISALCIACPAAVPYSFIGEIIPQKYRDITLSVTNSLQITASAMVPLIAWGILPLDFRINFGLYEFRSWRLLTIVNAVFFLITAFLMSFGPESPKYLVAQGKHDEALKVLQTIYAGNKKKSPDDYPVKKIKMPASKAETSSFMNSLKVQSLPLFKSPYLKWMSLNGFLFFGLFATGNGLASWVPDIVNRVLSGSVVGGMTACDILAQGTNETESEGIGVECVDSIETLTFVINMVANFSCAIIALAASTTVKFIGKKPLIVFVFCLIGTFSIATTFITHDLTFAAFLSAFPVLGLTVGPINAYAVATFPTQLRGMAISLAMMVGRLGSVVGVNVAPVLMNAACEVTFYLFGGLLILCGLAAFFLPKAEASSPPRQRIS